MTTRPDKSRNQTARARDQAAREHGHSDFDAMLAAEPAMADVVNVLTWMDARAAPPADPPERKG